MTHQEDNMIGIIDYDAGNIKSVEKALHYPVIRRFC